MTDLKFFEALLDDILLGTMIPKMQIERAIGPIIGFFLAEAISKVQGGRDIVVLCPEFPLRKPSSDGKDTHQSTNIDWLMFDKDSKELILLELKTTDTTFSASQNSIYRALQDRVSGAEGAGFLIDDLVAIKKNSKEKGKYDNVLARLSMALGATEIPIGSSGLPVKGVADHRTERLKAQFSGLNKLRVVYLAPRVCKPANLDDGLVWLSFGDLPVALEKHPYREHWPVLRNRLIGLDLPTRSARNLAMTGFQ